VACVAFPFPLQQSPAEEKGNCYLSAWNITEQAASTADTASQDAVRSRISLSQAPAGGDRRSQLKSEMDALRGEQGKFKADRGKLFDELRKLQESVSKKIKDQQAQRGKSGFKNVGEIEDRIQ
jgi:hypothetical protein